MSISVFKNLFLILLLTTISCSNKYAVPPRQVTGLSSTRVFDRGLLTLCSPHVKFVWNANPESDIAGYILTVVDEIKKADPDPAVRATANIIFNLPNVTMGFVKLYPSTFTATVVAVNNAGLQSPPSAPTETFIIVDCGSTTPPPPPPGTDPEPLPDDTIVNSNMSFVTTAGLNPKITHLKVTFTSKTTSSNTTLCPGQVFKVQGSADLQTWTDVGPLLRTPFPATEVIAPTNQEIDPTKPAIYPDKYFLRLIKDQLEDGSDEPAKFEPNCGQTSYNYPPADGDSLASNENSMSADGNTLVFSSKATVYSENDPKGSNSDIFIKNLLSGKVTRVSANSDSALEAACVGTCVSEDARISANGRFVAFASSRTDLGAYPTNDTKFVAVDKYRSLILYDKINKTHKVVSIDTDGAAPLLGRNSNASVSDDGRWVVFMNNIDNYRIYIKDMLDDGIGPEGSGGPLLRIGSNNNDRQPKMDRNGNYVVFASGFSTTGGSVYIWRRSDNRTQFVSQDGGFYSYGIASSGAFIDHTVFPGNISTIRLSQLRDAASSPNSILGPTLRDVTYANSPGGVWPDASRFQSTTLKFSDDGTKALYRGTDATGRGIGYYLFDLVNNAHTALPLLPTDYQMSAQQPTLSANGKKAAFVSRPQSLPGREGYQIFMYDLEPTPATLVSITNPNLTSNQSSALTISVAVSNLAFNQVTTYTVTGGSGSYVVTSQCPSFSGTGATGNYSCYGGSGPDVITVVDTLTSQSATTSVQISDALFCDCGSQNDSTICRRNEDYLYDNFQSYYQNYCESPPNEEVAMTVGYYDSMEIDPTKNYTLTYSGESSEMIFRINGESILQTYIMGNQLVQIPMSSGWDCNYDGSNCSGPNGQNITFENFDSNTLTTYVKYTR